jgi:hypothetical protein
VEKEISKGPIEMDIDAAFDEPAESLVTTSPFEATPDAGQLPPDQEILDGLEDVLEELTGGKSNDNLPSEFSPAPNLDEQKATLDPADIEALFEE